MLLLRYYVWIAPHLLLGFYLWSFSRRGLYKQFPWFFAYIGFELIQFVGLFALDTAGIWYPGNRLLLYRWILVWSQGISSLISFGVIYELMNRIILARSALSETLRPVVRWSGAVLLLLAAVASAYLKVGVEMVVNAFQILDFSTSVLQVGLLTILFFFSRVLRISWGSLPVGIALGLGIVGCVELSTAPLFSVFGAHRYALIDVVRGAGFHVGVLVWLGYLVLPERQPRFAGEPPQTSDLESWDQELQRIVPR